jgi:hypothetical protein
MDCAHWYACCDRCNDRRPTRTKGDWREGESRDILMCNIFQALCAWDARLTP